MADITIAENRVKDYYFSLEKIEALKRKLGLLNIRKIELQRKIDNKVIIDFEVNDFSVNAVSYDGVGGKAFNISNMSPQDRAIEKPFKLLEMKILRVDEEIFIVDDEIENLRQKNSEMEYILNGMKDEYRKIIEGFYRDKKSVIQMEFELCMSKNTIYRKKEQILEEISRWFGYCG